MAPNLRTMHVCKGGQISEVGAKFPRKFGPPGAIFPRKFGPGGGQIFGGGQISCDTGPRLLKKCYKQTKSCSVHTVSGTRGHPYT